MRIARFVAAPMFVAALLGTLLSLPATVGTGDDTRAAAVATTEPSAQLVAGAPSTLDGFGWA
ncbi:hypothetical protein [Kitasatospora brasiliensis]|uniref:hypothetical protein n=1 Tax=Kitasatospora brasiliensis TaxID=3058040 RepID=UPI00292F0A8A|nr:hypothetical protein [Kitasatospora sp. K002]